MGTNRKKGLAAAAVGLAAWLLSGIPLPLPAQAPEEGSVLRLFYQEKELVTTATKTPEDSRTAPAILDIITAEDIRNMGARTLSDLLRTLESVYVSVQPNSRESVWIRGVRNRYNDKVLLLVDGIPRRDPVYGHASIDEYLPLANVERVEIIRGPGSALYGTNAFAGIIHVVTKAPPGEASGQVRAGGGNYDTVLGSADGGFKAGGIGLYGYADYLETDGDGLEYETHEKPQTLKWNPKQRIAGGIQFTAGQLVLRLEKIHYYHTFFTDWDIPTWRWKDEGYWYDHTFLSADYNLRFGDRASIQFKAYYQDYRDRNFWRAWTWGHQGPGSGPGDVDAEIDVFKNGRRLGGEIQGSFLIGQANHIIAGATYDRESVSRVEDLYSYVQTGRKDRPFYIDPNALATWSLYCQDSITPRKDLNFIVGARADHHPMFGWKVSPRLGASFFPGSKLVLRILYGEAFRAPSFREFFTVDTTGSFPSGNRSLEPEEIRTIEGALSYTFSTYVEGHLVLFHQKTYKSIFSEQGRPYSNNPGESIPGVEAGIKLAWPNRATAYANYSYSRTDQYNVPRALAHVGINLPFAKRWNWNAKAEYVSARLRDPKDLYYYNPTVLPHRRPDAPSYILVDTTLRLMRCWDKLDLEFSIYNLFDQTTHDPTYEPTKYFDLKGPKRTFQVRAVLRF